MGQEYFFELCLIMWCFHAVRYYGHDHRSTATETGDLGFLLTADLTGTGVRETDTLGYPQAVGSLHQPAPDSAEQWAEELDHPSADAAWKRALTILGDETKARGWMNTPRDLFDGRTPEQLLQTSHPAEQRRVLEILIRIDYGVFS